MKHRVQLNLKQLNDRLFLRVDLDSKVMVIVIVDGCGIGMLLYMDFWTAFRFIYLEQSVRIRINKKKTNREEAIKLVMWSLCCYSSCQTLQILFLINFGLKKYMRVDTQHIHVNNN